MSSKLPFNFEEFYEAFGKSVSSDVIFEDGQVHIVPLNKADDTCASQESAFSEQGSPTRKHAKGRLLESADRRRLPWPIRALLEAQEPDGSWTYSSNFEFIINGTAPPPMEGIAGKLWATAIAITIWRQFPEYFELLETNYEKAMLYADENVLRMVRSVLQFDALDQIRPYKSDEARAIREQLAREAAAKRELELGEELKITRMREEEIRANKFSFIHARRLPMSTQQLFVTELGNEITKVFKPPAMEHEGMRQVKTPANLKVGQLVESCRRRRTNGSVLATKPCWHLCRIAAIDSDSHLLQLDFLDGDYERERRVPMKCVRATTTGTQETRATEFETLKNSWSEPIACKDEIARLDEARTITLRPLPWNRRHHLTLPDPTREKDESLTADKAARPISSQRPRSSTRRTQSRRDPRENALFQAASTALIQYDRAYESVQKAAQTGAKRYATAVLYRERFQAFDELTNALVTLVERTVDVLEAVWKWRQISSTGIDTASFVWKGSDFIVTLVKSLDFLGHQRELVEWYGEEFPLDGNPFMQSSSLLDKAKERGLQPSSQELRPLSVFPRAMSSTLPTWWPQARYSHELLRRIELAEQTAPQVA
ncbi:hypothetical protein PInf_012387 [Phytophthora infestans]|nr:hypothetical protein PInf_012387 [Phytophthora infestans]